MKTAIPALAAILFASSGCAMKTAEIKGHTLFADNGAEVEHRDGIWLAVVGNTRGVWPLVDSMGEKSVDEEASARVLADLLWRSRQGEFDFVYHLGDMVRGSSNAEWDRFDATFRELLAGESMPEIDGRRVPVLPVAGDGEFLGDSLLEGFGAAFPGVGAPIGFNRVASWYYVDVESQGKTWRLLTLDSNKEALGSRWDEQLRWIPRAVNGDFDNLMLFTHQSYVTLGLDSSSNPEDAVSELVENIEQHAGMMKLAAIFSAGANTSEALLPTGGMGTAHFVSGGAGPTSEGLARWGSSEGAGLGDVQLEPMYDLALQAEFDRRGEANQWEEAAFDRARATGEWEGFIAAYEADRLPTRGYWVVNLAGDSATVSLNMLKSDGSVSPLDYKMTFEGSRWSSGRGGE